MGYARRTRAYALVPLTLLAACGGCPPLAGVTVKGGSSAQQALVGEGLAEMEGWLRPEPVCLSRVKVASFRKADGVYRRPTRAIRIDAALDDERLAHTLRHEVCHAVDLQWGGLDHAPDAFTYAEGRGPERDGVADREAVAEVCALGAPALAVLGAVDCPGDPQGALAPVDAVRDLAYGDTGRSGRAVTLVPMASTEPLDDGAFPAALSVESHPDEGQLTIALFHGEGVTSLTVDAATGAHANPLELGEGFAAEGDPPELLGLLPQQWFDDPASGGQVALVNAELPRGAVHRLVAVDDEGAEALDLCVPPGAALARTADAVLLVVPEGPAVVWYRIEAG